VREHTAGLRPPRFLWVPFELGRPFGAPGDAAFQTRVLRAVLALLERTDGPVILEDFPEDAPAPTEEEMAGWVCPVNLPKPEAADEPAMLADVLREIGQLAPWYDFGREARDGRTTVGVSGLAIEDAARFLHGFFDGLPENPVPDVPLGEALRLAAEDVRAWYQEAATARPGAAATSGALADWFWGETAAGRMLIALRKVCTGSADAGVRTAAEMQIVPRSQRHRDA
jgi:hypothetical protein